MDGVHDMGGMYGLGAVEAEPDEPVFHERWEGRTFGLMMATGAAGLRGPLRPAIEELDPAVYLGVSYYERWALAIESVLVRAGTLTVADIDERAATGDPARDSWPRTWTPPTRPGTPSART